MMQIFARHKLAIIGVAILLAVGVWFGLSDGTPEPGLVETSFTDIGGPAEQGLVATLLTLRSIKLEGTILSNPGFMRLKDFSTEIVPEPIGRENPFAPLTFRSSGGSTNNSQIIFTPRP